MDQQAKAKARQKAERRYVRRILRHSLFAALFIFIGICVYAACYPRIQENRIRSHIASGQYDLAMTAISDLDDEDKALRLENMCRYAMACTEMDAENYEKARDGFLALGEYENAAALAADCAWYQAETCFAAGDLAGAQKMYLLIPDYSGVADRMMEVKYQQAGQYIETDPMMAFSLYQDLGDYKDSAEKISHLALEITGAADLDSAMAQLQDMSQAELTSQLAIVSARDSMRLGAVQAGGWHTVGLLPNGTVVAAGSNTYGQCDVSGFSGVTQIAVGAEHTVVLFADGTVAAVGRNEEGQCDVSSFSGVVQIACADYATFALFADGTVAAAGYLDYTGLDAWRGVTRICAGSYMVSGLYGMGDAYVSHPSAEGDMFTGLIDMGLTTGGAVGLTRSGDVAANFDSFPGWADMAAISVGSRCVLGIDVNGRVMAHFFRAGDAFEVAQIENAVCVSAGSRHSVIMTADGTVYAFGNNEHGQCDVSGWQMN